MSRRFMHSVLMILVIRDFVVSKKHDYLNFFDFVLNQLMTWCVWFMGIHTLITSIQLPMAIGVQEFAR